MTTIYDSRKLAAASGLPGLDELAPTGGFPDLLTRLDGSPVRTAADWPARRAELATMVQHYMYGYFPPPPQRLDARVRFADEAWRGGSATLKEVELSFDESPSTRLRVLMAVPRLDGGRKPAVFVGVNFGGNAAMVDDERVALPRGFVPNFIEGVKDNRPAEGYRGARAPKFPLELILDRGYGLACFYHGDLDPDKPDVADGVRADYYRTGQRHPDPHDWHTLAAWAWGMHRVVDYLQGDDSVDATRIATVGHSRNGKTSLLAAAFDERIKLAIVHQAGCGGSAPSRSAVGEKLADINKNFPHWFNEVFKKFTGLEDLLPFDQHGLIALCAPRSVLLSNATDDQWANPAGQFEMARLAAPAWELLGVQRPLGSEAMPPVGKLVDTPLGYWIREGKHSMGPEDWSAFLDYADRRL